MSIRTIGAPRRRVPHFAHAPLPPLPSPLAVVLGPATAEG